ncbi:MAG TPA: type II toxin-antitoxin system prevent-host-death family antitoxin [Solirubrobacteraceae bacterium]
MANVTIRELRNHGGEVVDRAARGEEITITRSGRPVASLRAVDADALPAATLLARWKHLPAVDPAGVRADLDEILDARL